MKSTELMLGDLVKVHFGEHNETIGSDVYGQVAELYDDGRIEVAFNGLSSVLWNIEKERGDEILPIPLTPEILEKNGFNKPQDAGDGTLICGMTIDPYKLTFQSIFGLPILTIENVVDNDNNHTCLVLKDEIYNVHELQHALRLCGIDKTITL